MKKTAILFFSAILSMGVQAAPRSLDAARKIAVEHAQKLGLTVAGASEARCMVVSASQNQPYYIFNNEGQRGWTIVSGDDSLVPIIGYSDEGEITSIEELPEVVQGMLSSYNVKATTQSGEADGISARALASIVAPKPIGPLCTTKWDQYAPYYNKTVTSGGTHCATCCVATAMAQILYYLYYVEGGIDETTIQSSIPTYTPTSGLSGGGVTGPRTYKWADMIPDYASVSYTSDQASAVATLMRDLGSSLQVKYGVSASTTNTQNVTSYACGHFGLQTTGINFVYPTDAANEKSYADTELNAYRPCIVCGDGHAFVCDGRDANGYYHFNFGYSGRGNGFYTFDALDGYQLTNVHMVTGLRLQSSISTKQQKVSLTYNNAVSQAALEPVGTEPGQYRKDMYDELQTWLDSAKCAIDDNCKYLNSITAPKLCQQISTAVQNLTERRVPYQNGYYYIKAYASYLDGKEKVMYVSSTSSNKLAWGSKSSGNRYLWHLEYDEENNAYKIYNKASLKYIYTVGKATQALLHKDSINAECEVWPTNLLPGTTTYNVSIRPIFEGYRSDNCRFLQQGNHSNGSASSGIVWGWEPYEEWSMWVLELNEADLALADVNADGSVNIADVNAVLTTMYGESEEFASRADVNGDGAVNITDVNAVLSSMTSE